MYEIAPEWVHVKFEEKASFTEVYGFAGSQGAINLEGVRLLPRIPETGEIKPSRVLLVYMHPSSTLQLMPMPQAMVRSGIHVLCAGSRFMKNDTPLIMEKVLLDLGAYIRHAREVWGYRKVVLCGWSGGGSMSLFYQSQAERPTVTSTPAGDAVDLAGAGLLPADAMIVQAAHLSRALMLSDWIDPSVIDENNPDDRHLELDIYDPRNPNQPPYSADFLAHFRKAQLARMKRRTDWVKETLERLRRNGGGEVERGFVTHRTMADPRFLDPLIDPNDRRPGWCYLGKPETVNTGPVGLGRFSTLRAWLSQWSPEDSQADGLKSAAAISVPLLAIENSADDAVPQPHVGLVHGAARSSDKTLKVIRGATHYYQGQPDKLAEAVEVCRGWMDLRGFID